MFKTTRSQQKMWLAGLVLAFILGDSAPILAEGEASSSFPETVTIGVFTKDGDDYQLIPDRDLVMEVGVPCFVWARTSSADEEVEREHLHYNAADQTSYVDGIFTWTEYGPEHSEEAIRERCAARRGGSDPKHVDSTGYFQEQHGDRDPYYLQLVNEGCPDLEHFYIANVGEYQGINAIPAVTMQIHPSSGGDTVANNAEYPPGEGAKVVVGFWEHPLDYEPQCDDSGNCENPCEGEPALKIAYPVEYGSEKCYAWIHWAFADSSDSSLEGDSRYDAHENSARNFSCGDDGDLRFSQWTTMTCRLDQPTANCRNKTVSRAHCSRDNPPTIWSQILSGCGKKP